MTLAKAVEALSDISKIGCRCASSHIAKHAIASLPEPMTEKEILNLVTDKVVGKADGVMYRAGRDMFHDVISALRDAGCLYVVEDE